MLLGKQLELGHAKVLLALDPEKQLEAAQKIIKAGMTVRAAEQLIKTLQQPPRPSSAATTTDNDTLRLQQTLSAKLGAKVVIVHKGNGSGKLVINYAGLEELDGIIEKLG